GGELPGCDCTDYADAGAAMLAEFSSSQLFGKVVVVVLSCAPGQLSNQLGSVHGLPTRLRVPGEVKGGSGLVGGKCGPQDFARLGIGTHSQQHMFWQITENICLSLQACVVHSSSKLLVPPALIRAGGQLQPGVVLVVDDALVQCRI